MTTVYHKTRKYIGIVNTNVVGGDGGIRTLGAV
jgi:hypothetical protein